MCSLRTPTFQRTLGRIRSVWPNLFKVHSNGSLGNVHNTQYYVVVAVVFLQFSFGMETLTKSGIKQQYGFVGPSELLEYQALRASAIGASLGGSFPGVSMVVLSEELAGSTGV